MRLLTVQEFQRTLTSVIDYARAMRTPVLIQLNEGPIVFLLPLAKFRTLAALELAERKGSPLIYATPPQRLAEAHLMARKYARRPIHAGDLQIPPRPVSTHPSEEPALQ